MSMTMQRMALLSLLFLGISATAGGALLVYDPTGSTIGLPLVLLTYSPFATFLIPGLVLLVVLGLNSLVAAYLIWKDSSRFAGWVIFQGVALLIWISTQVWMIGLQHLLQLAMCVLGLVLLSLGWKLYRGR